MKSYFADVRIFVYADDAKEAAQEINDALAYVARDGGFEIYNYDTVVDMDMQEAK